jgi:hypothetical protein
MTPQQFILIYPGFLLGNYSFPTFEAYADVATRAICLFTFFPAATQLDFTVLRKAL